MGNPVIILCKTVVLLSCYIGGSSRVNALLRPLRRLSVAAYSQTKLYSDMGSSDPIVPLPVLVKQLSSASGQTLSDALDYLSSRSAPYKKRDYGSKEIGLLPVLVSIISSDKRLLTRVKVLEIFQKQLIILRTIFTCYLGSLDLFLCWLLHYRRTKQKCLAMTTITLLLCQHSATY